MERLESTSFAEKISHCDANIDLVVSNVNKLEVGRKKFDWEISPRNPSLYKQISKVEYNEENTERHKSVGFALTHTL